MHNDVPIVAQACRNACHSQPKSPNSSSYPGDVNEILGDIKLLAEQNKIVSPSSSVLEYCSCNAYGGDFKPA